jgi:hypothetical protein
MSGLVSVDPTGNWSWYRASACTAAGANSEKNSSVASASRNRAPNRRACAAAVGDGSGSPMRTLSAVTVVPSACSRCRR